MPDRDGILVVEDDPQLRRFLRTGLAAHGYRVSEAETGRDALAQVTTAPPQVMLLDLWLPDMDGCDVVSEVRGWSQLPIIVVSSRDTEASKIAALDAGADDYVTKPFGMGELLARIRAALRHRLRQEGREPVYRSGAIEVNLVAREVRREGELVRLSPKEYDLLRLLVLNADKVMTHQHILRTIWGPAQMEQTQYLRVFVQRLRQKLEPDPARPQHIVTESGVGYRLRTL